VNGGRKWQAPVSWLVAATSTSYLIKLANPVPDHLRHASAPFGLGTKLLNLNHHHSPLMLRLGLFAYTRPLFRPVAPRSGLKVFSLRSFGSVEARPRILEVLRNRPPNVVTRPFQQSSRGIVDSAVISRPSQTEAWRRYAVTAVCCIARAEPATYTFVGHGRRHYHRRRGVFEQGHAR
jgi:hypothetical protein